MALWNDTSATERSLFEAANALANLVRQNGNNKSQLIRETAAQESSAANAIVQDFNKMLQGSIKDVNGILDDKRNLNGLVEGLKKAGATDNIINSVKEAPTYQAAKEIVDLNLVKPHAMDLGDKNVYKNPLTGETFSGKKPLTAKQLEALAKVHELKNEFKEGSPLNLGEQVEALNDDEFLFYLMEKGLARKSLKGDTVINMNRIGELRQEISQYPLKRKQELKAIRETQEAKQPKGVEFQGTPQQTPKYKQTEGLSQGTPISTLSPTPQPSNKAPQLFQENYYEWLLRNLSQ